MNTFNQNEVANLKLPDYSKISARVKAFSSTYETAQILTEIVKDELGHVIFKAHAVVDGLTRGTGHAHVIEGSSNINNSSYYAANDAYENPDWGKDGHMQEVVTSLVEDHPEKAFNMISTAENYLSNVKAMKNMNFRKVGA